MKLGEVKKLHSGDRVFWNDPDGSCSRVLRIKSITLSPPNVVAVEEEDGSVVECYARELKEETMPSVDPELQELKPCPFCGGPVQFVQVGTLCQPCIVTRRSCSLEAVTAEMGAECGTKWNRRTAPSGLRKHRRSKAVLPGVPFESVRLRGPASAERRPKNGT